MFVTFLIGISKPNSLKDWNTLMEEMIYNDPNLEHEDILRFKLLRNRRNKPERSINGPAEWYLKDTYGNKALEKLK